MKLLKQFKLSLIDSTASLKLLRLNSIKWMVLYFTSGLLVFGAFIWLMLSNEVAIKNAFLDYLFPQSWHTISEQLADFLFESQTKTVLSNLILSGSLVMASIFLFPIKEKYSAAFEKDAKFHNGHKQEFSLAIQALEEVKLLLLYITVQSVILWVGYYPFEWTKFISISSSYLFLFFTFGLDFISPTLQRHKTQYSLILKTLLKQPLIPLFFGLLYCLPVILLSQWIFSLKDLTFIEISSILFIVNLFLLTLAVPAGTRIASSLFKQVNLTLEPTTKTMVTGYSITTIVLMIGLFLHSQLISSLHHKSQLLKAEYDLDWSSIQYETPSLAGLINGKALSHFSFDVVINNPTKFDLVIEDSTIIIQQKKLEIAAIDINGFTLLSGENRRISMKLNSNSDFSLISNFGNILSDWRVDVHLKVWPGIPFIFNIVEP